MAANLAAKNNHLRSLQQNVQSLLTDQEKYYFSYALKDYKTYKSLDKLLRSLLTCLNTPEKQQLFKDVRHLILPSQQQKYDTLIENVGILSSQDEPSKQEATNFMNGAKDTSPSAVGKYRVVSLINDKVNNIDLGFTICGGKEFGIGIYVSRVAENSPSYIAGLRRNDFIIEVNGISLQNISLVSAANLFSSLSKLKIVVKEEIQTGIFDHTSSLNPWSKENKKTIGDMNGFGNPNFEQPEQSKEKIIDQNKTNNNILMRRNSSILNTDEADNERRIKLMVTISEDQFIGFNIRGGCEYGLGIYVSSVDAGSLADQSGLKVGDQILDANGKSFEEILHKDAVDFLKSNSNMILTVKAVGRIPEEKCYVEEYSWVTADGKVFLEANPRKTDYLSSSMPLTQTADIRDFAADTGDLPWNQTINIPPGLNSSKEYVDSETQVSVDAQEAIPTVEPAVYEAPAEPAINITSAEACTNHVNQAKDEVDNKMRRSPSSTSLISKKSSDSGKSDRGTRSSLNSGEHSDSDKSRDGNFLSTSKAKRSKSFLQKQGDKLKAKFSFRAKKKTAKQNLFDSDIFQKSEKSHEWLQNVNDKAKEMLNYNDYKALEGHIKQPYWEAKRKPKLLASISESRGNRMLDPDFEITKYLEKGDIELFTSNALEILDTTGKALLLKDVRTIVFPHDIGRFDARVAKREMENMIALGRDPIESPILDVELSEKPPKKTLVTAVQDKDGKFKLKSKTEADRMERERQENTKKASKKYAQQRSILERETTIQRFKSFSNVPRPSKQHAESWGHDPDNPDDELDFIPTKEVPQKVEEVYAQVDKIKYASQSGVTKDKGASDVPLIITDDDQRPAQRTMSDIDEGLEDLNLSPTTKSVSHDDDDDDDDDGYSHVEPLLDKTQTRRIVVPVKKESNSLGISISGGKGSTQQPEIRIERVYPTGAVAESKLIKAGCQILYIDGESLHDATHNEAVDIIRRCFSNKSRHIMEMTILV